jgi:serine/threonine protein phosphatase 1
LLKKYYQENKVPFTFNGRRFAVGDIHGCYKTFRSLIENKIELTQYDQLFLLGDYIHKGPRSKDTLNYILKLIKRGYKVFPLRGNHEDELLNAAKKRKFRPFKVALQKEF